MLVYSHILLTFNRRSHQFLGWIVKSTSFTVEGRETTISIGYRLLSTLTGKVKKPAILFVSKNLPQAFRKYIEECFSRSVIIPVEDGEAIKTPEGYYKIITALSSHSVGREDIVGYAGGGTLGDVVGFAAATFKRGVNLISVPTTFLAQIDGSIGGKNAINFANTKNLVGSFCLPVEIYSDLYFIEKMPQKMFLNGLGELLKYYILNPEEFNWSLFGEDFAELQGNMSVLEEIVFTCSKLKMDYVAKDFYDKNGIRRMLNFGHTIGHALESATDFRISHGEGVYWGMLIESFLAQSTGVNASRTISLLKPFVPMFNMSEELVKSRFDSLAGFVQNDKKVSGETIKLPFPLNSGGAGDLEISLATLSKFLEKNTMDELLE